MIRDAMQFPESPASSVLIDAANFRLASVGGKRLGWIRRVSVIPKRTEEERGAPVSGDVGEWGAGQYPWFFKDPPKRK